jgi:hypothetical protein
VFGSPVGCQGRSIGSTTLTVRELWKEIMPRDPAAFGGFGST